MKKQVLTISFLLFLCFNLLFGQDTITTYFNRSWKKCNKEFAVYYRNAYPDSSGMWVVKDYHMNGQLQMFGKYSDKKLKKQQGPAIFYHYNGNVSQIGKYLDNKKTGIWKIYYSNGDIECIGKRTNNKNDSTWTYYNINSDKPFGQIHYINGKAEGESKWYFESGKICEIANYKKDKIKSKVDYNEDGQIIEIKEKDGHVEFIGGNANMIRFLQENLKYPEKLRLQSKEGVVFFHFLVCKDGKIVNVEYIKSDEPLFNKEALRVFTLIKYMKPARNHGQIVEEECTLPITFRLI